MDRIGQEKILDAVSIETHGGQIHIPAAFCILARGVASRSPIDDDCLGGELMIILSFNGR